MLKRLFNVEGRWLVLAAVVTGIILSVLSQLAIQDPSFDTWFRAVMGGLMAGLMAAGIYDATLQRYPKDSA